MTCAQNTMSRKIKATMGIGKYFSLTGTGFFRCGFIDTIFSLSGGFTSFIDGVQF